jgi:hypothetical protein
LFVLRNCRPFKKRLQGSSRPKKCKSKLIFYFINCGFKAAGEIGEESTDFIDFFLNAETDMVEKEITGVYDKSNVHVSFLKNRQNDLNLLSFF